MLTCRDINERSSEYLDQQMSFMQRMNFRMHLMLCKHCSRFMRQLEAVVHTLHRLSPQQSTSEEQLEELVDKLHQDPQA